jgi:hypothetical protein
VIPKSANVVVRHAGGFGAGSRDSRARIQIRPSTAPRLTTA